MLAWYMLCPVSVHTENAQHIKQLCWNTEAITGLSCAVLQRNSVISNPFGTLSQTLNQANFQLL